MKLRSVPPIRAVLQLVTVGAVLRVTARLSRAVTVMSPATTSAPAVMTSLLMAATVRAHYNCVAVLGSCFCVYGNGWINWIN